MPVVPIWRPAAPDHDGDGSTMSRTTYVPKFSFLHWIKRCKEPLCPWSPSLELWRTLEVPGWGFGSWSWWGGVYNIPNNLCSEIQLSTLNMKVQRTLMSSKSLAGVGSWLGFGSWSWWGGVHNVPNNPGSKIQISTLTKKVQRTPMTSKSWSDSGGSWLEFWFLIMMGMGVQCPKLPMFWNSAFYIE